MRHILKACALSLVIATNVCAQDLPADRYLGSGSNAGTVVCKAEKSMVALMNAGTSEPVLLTRLIINGDCLVMPYGWSLLVAEDPRWDQKEVRASKWTIRTPDGIVHMWGAPIGED
ncbi:hypothetical protein DWU98_21395 [Dyella monticola]|uniref:Uncharacterized protein n=1 Tax=Dyella monticola TaxID=1927958 RepID=A0A370WRI2_9GAMM|nr:hypothetical protein [Dyella monticola]RDS78734.1 hypothetical protein DWU98_21395 [Dyella monticola]